MAIATEDFIQQIDPSNMSNTEFLEDWQFNEWRIASWHTQESICYNRDKFEELGLPAPVTYNDLTNPKLKGRISIPDITSGGGLVSHRFAPSPVRSRLRPLVRCGQPRAARSHLA